MTVPEESTTRSIVWQQRGPENAAGPVPHGTASWSSHVCLHPAWTDGIDQDAALPQLVGEHDRESVERDFRDPIRWRVTVHARQRTGLARHVDNAAAAAGTRQPPS